MAKVAAHFAAVVSSSSHVSCVVFKPVSADPGWINYIALTGRCFYFVSSRPEILQSTISSVETLTDLVVVVVGVEEVVLL